VVENQHVYGVICYDGLMKQVTFITGNQNKADYLAKYLDMDIEHRKLDLDELQSLDLRTIVDHKVRQAYDLIKSPVLVEDVSLEFCALGRFPGPFVRYLVEEVDEETICRTLDGLKRDAIGRSMFGYYNGEEVVFFEGSIKGTIADHPLGENGFGWDKIFIPEGYDVTRAELGDEDYQKVYMQIRPFAALKSFFEKHK
jgi:non-canonical purine NTP pyrophosphatase (RdgB/HAM1 family)